jgi:uncharacterized protein DUF3800
VSTNSNAYSPILHLASAAFPPSDRHKCMLMLSAYMDETGHSADEQQRFNGMAGLMAPTKRLLRMQRKWDATMGRFHLPYFHMKDFAASRGHYAGWGETKRRNLYGRLLAHINGAQPMFVGSIMQMSDYRSLTDQQRAEFGDPYYVGFMIVTSFIATAAEKLQPPDEKIALIFSDQVEFKYRAQKLYDDVGERFPLMRRRTESPLFREMPKFAALQAADIVAYELYKEYDRQLYRREAEPRHGYKVLCQISRSVGLKEPMFAFETKASLIDGNGVSHDGQESR